jgi:hypothetical protein
MRQESNRVVFGKLQGLGESKQKSTPCMCVGKHHLWLIVVMNAATSQQGEMLQNPQQANGKRRSRDEAEERRDEARRDAP